MKPFRIGIIQYDERTRKMKKLAKYLPPPSIKGGEYNQEDWTARDKELYEREIHVATKDGLPTSMQDEFEDKSEDYCSLTHEKWCNLLSTMEVKDNRKRAAAQINMLATSKSAPVNSDSNSSVTFPCNDKARTGVLPTRKNKGKKNPNHHGTHH